MHDSLGHGGPGAAGPTTGGYGGLDLVPHHDGSATYVPDQAPLPGTMVTVFLRVPAAAAADRVVARYVSDGEPRYAEAVVDRVGPGGPGGVGSAPGGDTWWRAEIPVRNPVTPYRFLLVGGRGAAVAHGYRWHNALGTFGHDVPDMHDFRLVTDAPPPGWARDAIVYEIFPDRFARSRAAADRPTPDWAIPCDWDTTPVIGNGPQTPYQLYGGDLDGVVEHLDHIAGLGADTVYLTPFFPARSNHRYDASGFEHVDPVLGGDAAMGRLVEALHRRGMRLIGDITTNHCGDAHRWFTTAAADPAAPEREMFYFGPDGDYESWWGISSLPKFNWASVELRRRFFGTGNGSSNGNGNGRRAGGTPDAGITTTDPGVIRHWLSCLDGWRVDVANMTGRSAADDYAHAVATMVRRAVTSVRPEGLLIAEHNHDASGDLDRGGWHGTMNYAGFTRPVWAWLGGSSGLDNFLGVPVEPPRVPGTAALATMRAFGAVVSWRARAHSWTLLGSHDTPRIRSVVGSPDLVAVAAGLLATLPGTPMLYAGDEWGLRGYNGEDGRRPMPWNRPDRQEAGTYARFRDLFAVRRALPALRAGGLRWAYADDDTLVFVRETASQAVVVAARRASGEPVRVPGLAGVLARGSSTVYGGAAPLVVDPATGTVTVPGDGPAFHIWVAGS